MTFACFVPCITYVPLLTINTPIISQLFKVLLVNSIACFIHFLLFLPKFVKSLWLVCTLISENLMFSLLLLITEKASRFWRLFSCEMCCVEEEGSIYYIPTAPRPIIPAYVLFHLFFIFPYVSDDVWNFVLYYHNIPCVYRSKIEWISDCIDDYKLSLRRVYQPGEYAYTLPKSIAPPGYLAIGAPDRYGMKPGTKRRETRDREAEGRRRKRRNRAHSISEVLT